MRVDTTNPFANEWDVAETVGLSQIKIRQRDLADAEEMTLLGERENGLGKL